MEIWKDVEGYENMYQVSNLGRVKSLARTRKGRYECEAKVKEKILKPHLSTGGYYSLHFYKDNKRKGKVIHRLVAEAFLNNPNNLPQVNHKDEVKINNITSNLEWCTNQYNGEYSTAKHYKVINPEGKMIEIFNMRKFCRENELNGETMNQVCKGKIKCHRGWRKYNDG